MRFRPLSSARSASKSLGVEGAEEHRYEGPSVGTGEVGQWPYGGGAPLRWSLFFYRFVILS